MSRAVPWILVSSLLALAGCSESHAPDVDSGIDLSDAPWFVDAPPSPDVGVTTECNPLGGPGAVSCVTHYDNHVCGDVAQAMQCFDNMWVCPVGTAPDDDCWCSAGAPAGCVCTESGWSCVPQEDAGVSSFACGPVSCARNTEYCQHVVSDVGGEPDAFACRTYPSGCVDGCACFDGISSGVMCTDDGAGGLTLLYPGG